MRKEIYRIWENDPAVTLTSFVDGGKEGKRPAVIVLPGGGYVATADREADPVAIRFAELGYAAFVLRYSTLYESFDAVEGGENGHVRFPQPLLQVAAAISFVRDCSAELGIDPQKIALIGFSAGGHLASNYCNKWNTPLILEGVGLNPERVRPNGCVLCYAATSLFRKGGERMIEAVFGDGEATDDMLRKYSAQFGVNVDTPPTYLWHSAKDETVPVKQTYDMSKALEAAGIVHEADFFPEGGHATGLSVGLKSGVWPLNADAFLKKNM